MQIRLFVMYQRSLCLSFKYVFNLFVVQASFFSFAFAPKKSPLIRRDQAQSRGYDSTLESRFLFCHDSCFSIRKLDFAFIVDTKLLGVVSNASKLYFGFGSLSFSPSDIAFAVWFHFWNVFSAWNELQWQKKVGKTIAILDAIATNRFVIWRYEITAANISVVNFLLSLDFFSFSIHILNFVGSITALWR